jgi:hypothetical protein
MAAISLDPLWLTLDEIAAAHEVNQRFSNSFRAQRP